MFVSLPFEEFLRGVFLYLVSHVPRVWPRARYLFLLSLPPSPSPSVREESERYIARYSRLELTLYNTFVIRIDECVTVPRSLTSRREMADDRGSLGLFPFLSRAPRFFEWPSRADQHDAKSSVRAFPHRQTVLHCPRRYVPPSSLPLPHPLLISSYSSFSSTRIIRYLFIWERFNLI